MLLILAMFVLFTDDNGGPPVAATEGTDAEGTELLLLDVVVAVGGVAVLALLLTDIRLLLALLLSASGLPELWFGIDADE